MAPMPSCWQATPVVAVTPIFLPCPLSHPMICLKKYSSLFLLDHKSQDCVMPLQYSLLHPLLTCPGETNKTTVGVWMICL